MANHPLPNVAGAAHRARWLGEVAQALDQANRLLFRLREVEESSQEANMLHARILTLRAEINALQRGVRQGPQHQRRPNEVFHPKRMK